MSEMVASGIIVDNSRLGDVDKVFCRLVVSSA